MGRVSTKQERWNYGNGTMYCLIPCDFRKFRKAWECAFPQKA